MKERERRKQTETTRIERYKEMNHRIKDMEKYMKKKSNQKTEENEEKIIIKNKERTFKSKQ